MVVVVMGVGDISGSEVDGMSGAESDSSTSDNSGSPVGDVAPGDGVSGVAAVVGVVGVGVVAVHLKENSKMFRFCAVSRLIV